MMYPVSLAASHTMGHLAEHYNAMLVAGTCSLLCRLPGVWRFHRQPRGRKASQLPVCTFAGRTSLEIPGWLRHTIIANEVGSVDVEMAGFTNVVTLQKGRGSRRSEGVYSFFNRDVHSNMASSSEC